MPITAKCLTLPMHSPTTAHNPQSDGLVEWLHRWLKDALHARATVADWSDHLLWVILGICSAFTRGSGFFPAEAVFLLPAGPARPVCLHCWVPIAILPGEAAEHRCRPLSAASLPQLPTSSYSLQDEFLARSGLPRCITTAAGSLYNRPFRVFEWPAHYFLL